MPVVSLRGEEYYVDLSLSGASSVQHYNSSDGSTTTLRSGHLSVEDVNSLISVAFLNRLIEVTDVDASIENARDFSDAMKEAAELNAYLSGFLAFQSALANLLVARRTVRNSQDLAEYVLGELADLAELYGDVNTPATGAFLSAAMADSAITELELVRSQISGSNLSVENFSLVWDAFRSAQASISAAMSIGNGIEFAADSFWDFLVQSFENLITGPLLSAIDSLTEELSGALGYLLRFDGFTKLGNLIELVGNDWVNGVLAVEDLIIIYQEITERDAAATDFHDEFFALYDQFSSQLPSYEEYSSEVDESLLQAFSGVVTSEVSDIIFGGSSNDFMLLHGGDDIAYGGRGDDDLRGEEGNDDLRGQDGDDDLFGGSGNDTLFGGQNSDDLRGESGRDTLNGEDGSDTLFGGSENDFLYGGANSDVLNGEEGSDSHYGGSGTDTARLNFGWRDYTKIGSSAGDFRLSLEGDTDRFVSIERLEFADRTFTSIRDYFDSYEAFTNPPEVDPNTLPNEAPSGGNQVPDVDPVPPGPPLDPPLGDNVPGGTSDTRLRVTTIRDADVKTGDSVPIADLYPGSGWFDGIGFYDINYFAVGDRTPGGGYLTYKGDRVPDQAFYQMTTDKLRDWAFVAGGPGEVDEIGFNIIQLDGTYSPRISTSAAAKVTATAADLIIEDVEVRNRDLDWGDRVDHIYEPGDRFTVEFDVRNIGNADADVTEAGLYFYDGSRWDEVDTDSTSAISDGSQDSNETLSFNLSSNLSDGIYTIAVVADHKQEETEWEELELIDQNYFALRIAVASPPPEPLEPDLDVRSFSIDQTTWTEGETVALDWVVENEGNASASSTRTGIYLSDNSRITTDDTRIDISGRTGTLSPGEDVSQSETITVDLDDFGLTPGTYYVGVVADYGNDLAESSKTNNGSSARQITLERPNSPPSLSVFVATVFEENSIGPVADFVAFDPDGDQLDVRLEGADASFFRISGDQVLFLDPPDFENPNDTARENTYELSLVVSDDRGEEALREFLVRVLDVPEGMKLTGTEVDDLLLGGELDDTLNGGEGSDDLNGASGHDTLNGGAGADTMDGGLGNDRFFVDDAGDVVLEAAEEGTDLLSTSIDFTLPDNVEQGSTLGSGDVAITGNGLANFISGNTGANLLRGEGGADRLIAGLGDDTLEGGAGNDVLEGQGGADRFVMTADNGDDQILDWEASTDVLDFGALGLRFVDLAITSSGNEAVITFDDPAGGTGSVRLIDVDPEVLEIGIVADPGGVGSAGGIPLTAGTSGADNLAATNGDDDVVGLAGNDILNGRAGADTMLGGFGNDRYFLDQSSDQVIELEFQGADQMDAGFNFTLSDHVERGAVLGGGAVDITGNALGNFITGSALSNVLRGEAGRDRLIGFDGEDTLIGGLDNDVMEGGADADLFVFEAESGIDLITDFEVGVDLIDVTAFGIAFADMTIIDGALGARVIFDLTPGSVDLVTVQGVAAADLRLASFVTIFGENQPPILGTEGNDVLFGSIEDDELQALGGNDLLNGLGGADLMLGGPGDDRYFLDDGGDVVVELANEGTDLVSSFVDVVLSDHVENGSALGTGDVDLTGNTLGNALTGNAGSNVLSGEGGADNLQGLGGADTIDGGQGADVLRGGLGADTFLFETGDGADQIIDFEIGVDTIDLSATGLAFGDLTITNTGPNANITYGTDTVTLFNVSTAQLGEDQFLFGDNRLPDLIVFGVTLSTSNAAPGDTVFVSYSGQNIGDGSDVGSIASFYISDDPLITKDDQRFTSQFWRSLDPGEILSSGRPITIDSSRADGVYYIGVIANDYFGGPLEVIESDYTNNASEGARIEVQSLFSEGSIDTDSLFI